SARRYSRSAGAWSFFPVQNFPRPACADAVFAFRALSFCSKSFFASGAWAEAASAPAARKASVIMRRIGVSPVRGRASLPPRAALLPRNLEDLELRRRRERLRPCSDEPRDVVSGDLGVETVGAPQAVGFVPVDDEQADALLTQ